jgi:ABC-type cobalamin/Fe3+-siderophores transport system ATPase subunit
MKADFRISQRNNISNRLSANSSMKMSRAHEKLERMRLASHDNITLLGLSGGERAPA